MVRQQEQIDSTYARRVAERMEREEYERRRRAEIHDMEVAQKMQTYEATRNANQHGGEHYHQHRDRQPPVKVLPMAVPDVNRVGLPLVQNANFEPVGRHPSNMAVTHSLRNLRLKENSGGNYVPPPPPPPPSPSPSSSSSSSSTALPVPPPPLPPPSSQVSNVEASPANLASNYAASSSASPSSLTSAFQQRVSRIRTAMPATLLPEDLNEIVTDVDLQEEANKRMQEEKDAELARMLQQQEEEILSEEIDRDRMMAIEAQDKELAKLLYEKEKAKLRRAKERARQRALLKRQQQQDGQSQNSSMDQSMDDGASHSSHGQGSCTVDLHSQSAPLPPTNTENVECKSIAHHGEPVHFRPELEGEQRSRCGGDSLHTSTLASGRSAAPALLNVAMHIDPTYLSQQSSSMPNSLIFQDGDTTAPPYMPIQGHRRNSPFVDKKTKKSKSKDGCKQQ